MYGDENALISFSHVDDVVDGLIKIAEAETSKVEHQIFMCGETKRFFFSSSSLLSNSDLLSFLSLFTFSFLSFFLSFFFFYALSIFLFYCCSLVNLIYRTTQKELAYALARGAGKDIKELKVESAPVSFPLLARGNLWVDPSKAKNVLGWTAGHDCMPLLAYRLSHFSSLPSLPSPLSLPLLSPSFLFTY